MFGESLLLPQVSSHENEEISAPPPVLMLIAIYTFREHWSTKLPETVA